MKPSWFKRGSRIYEPVHIVGFVITLLIILFLVPVYVDVILNGYSAGDDLYHMFVYTTCTILMGANGI